MACVYKIVRAHAYMKVTSKDVNIFNALSMSFMRTMASFMKLHFSYQAAITSEPASCREEQVFL